MSFNIIPVASGYQEIHPYSAMNIDSENINTSLIMMKEWSIKVCIPPEEGAIAPKAREIHYYFSVCQFWPMQQKTIQVDKYTYTDTVIVILSEWYDTGVMRSENLKKKKLHNKIY